MKTTATSRRDFLKQAGFLVVGFSLVPAAVRPAAAQQVRLPGSLGGSPMLDSWLRINADGTITVVTGKIELGQGIRTAVAQLAAEELDISLQRVRVVMADTGQTPNEGYTAGSGSIERSGMAIRSAAAEARQVLLELATERLGRPAGELEVRDGVVSVRGGGGETTYWELLGGKRLERRATGQAPLKRPEQYSLVGKPAQRLEIPQIVRGEAVFVQDLRLPGMLHARILRPPTYSAKLVSIPEAEVAAMEGVVKVVRDGSFVAVAAEREEEAVWAWERLKAESRWDEGEKLQGSEDLYAHLRQIAGERRIVRQAGQVEAALRDAPVRLEASYSKPYIMHGSIGPSCAVAQMEGDDLTVWTHSQGVFPLRRSLSGLLGMAEEKVRVIGVAGAGCYGHNGADDVAADAALVARAVAGRPGRPGQPGRPVRVQWMREDEHKWEPYGTAMIIDLQGALDGEGRIVAWQCEILSDSHSTRPGGNPASLLPSRHLARPLVQRGGGFSGGASRNADLIYDVPNQQIAGRAFNGPLRISALRSLGAYANTFAIESFMDELAAKAGVDAVAFRLRHLRDARGRAVIEAAAKALGWGKRLPEGRGHGIGFARYKNSAAYCAVGAEVEAEKSTGAVRALRMVAAIDAGQAVNPDGLRNQTEGGMIQSASWTLLEEVPFNERGVASEDWDLYPILGFREAPATEVIVLDRPDDPPVGAGEAAQGPAAAAIANAVWRALGVRIRQLPITPERVRAESKRQS